MLTYDDKGKQSEKQVNIIEESTQCPFNDPSCNRVNPWGRTVSVCDDHRLIGLNSNVELKFGKLCA